MQEKLGGEHANYVDMLVELMKADERRLTNIHVALSFKDLVAQRVAKLVTFFEQVQQKILKLVVIVGIKQKKDGNSTKNGGRGNEMVCQLEASQIVSKKVIYER